MAGFKSQMQLLFFKISNKQFIWSLVKMITKKPVNLNMALNINGENLIGH
jgi:hypothetical protein